jgi:hypothetical protein
MLDRALQLIRPRRPGPRLHWINSDIAIGGVNEDGEWQEVYESGVRAVVDLHAGRQDLGIAVRRNGMRYLHLFVRPDTVPSAEELQIVTGWVLDRASEEGRVLIQDSHSHFNDGLVAVASLIKSGLPAHLALLALRRAVPDEAFDMDQNAQLIKFAAAQ